jgi:multidrug efflux pump subunit AcrA (membrane-fusion protein)
MLNRRTMLALVPAMILFVGVLGIAANRPMPAARLRANAPAVGLPVRAAPQTTIKVIGTFVAPNQAALGFKTGGRLAEIRVQEGSQVKKGDALAVLDTAELQASVQQAQAALAGAQARLAQAKAPSTNADIAAAQAAVDAALKNYEKVRAGPTLDDLMPLKAQVDTAKAAVDQAQAAYDRIGGASNPMIGMLPQSLQLQQATNNYQAALANYENAVNHPTAAELAAAQSQVNQAQAALSRLQPTSDNVAAAQAQVDQAQAGLTLAKQQLANATLTAPMDGTVIWLGPHVGELVAVGAPVLTLADLAHLQLQAGVDESALALVRVGQKVLITPEAFKENQVSGQVSRIGWMATTTAGVVNVPVTIDVGSNPGMLRPGLSATAEIQIQ